MESKTDDFFKKVGISAWQPVERKAFLRFLQRFFVEYGNAGREDPGAQLHLAGLTLGIDDTSLAGFLSWTVDQGWDDGKWQDLVFSRVVQGHVLYDCLGRGAKELGWAKSLREAEASGSGEPTADVTAKIKSPTAQKSPERVPSGQIDSDRKVVELMEEDPRARLRTVADAAAKQAGEEPEGSLRRVILVKLAAVVRIVLRDCLDGGTEWNPPGEGSTRWNGARDRAGPAVEELAKAVAQLRNAVSAAPSVSGQWFAHATELAAQIVSESGSKHLGVQWQTEYEKALVGWQPWVDGVQSAKTRGLEGGTFHPEPVSPPEELVEKAGEADPARGKKRRYAELWRIAAEARQDGFWVPAPKRQKKD